MTLDELISKTLRAMDRELRKRGDAFTAEDLERICREVNEETAKLSLPHQGGPQTVAMRDEEPAQAFVD
jgi:hypothetical protein